MQLQGKMKKHSLDLSFQMLSSIFVLFSACPLILADIFD